MFSTKRWLAALFMVALVAVGAYAVLAQSEAEVMRFEIAEDGARFVFGDHRLFEDGMPAYGSQFVTQGYIYPDGTLSGSNGVLANGEPEFPDLVVGEWTCYGYLIGDGAHTTTGKWVVSTQIFEFENGTIITDGFELVDTDTPISRAITGGTGEYVSVSGEQVQELRGFTDAMGVNLVVEFQIAE